uniref:CCHC-type domain-containing protein n=1 Tax=Pygocentrus nattereri TaxID=42514 RepID=A0AAR2LUZ3_PYGNA
MTFRHVSIYKLGDLRGGFAVSVGEKVGNDQIYSANVPLFISNDLIAKELSRFGKFASAITLIPLGCKTAVLKHVLSFRRQVFMFLNSADKTLEASFRVAHGESSFMVYTSTDSQRCFECDDIGHKWFACPHKNQVAAQENRVSPAAERCKTAEVEVTQDPDEGTSFIHSWMRLKADLLMSASFSQIWTGLDGNGEEPHPQPASALTTVISMFNLIDVWREKFPRIKQYTWVKGSAERVFAA